jgi:CelD/BcsL family acetyltransferase involved in cellulose biosynthesis
MSSDRIQAPAPDRGVQGAIGALRLERVALESCDWQAMDALPDRVVFQTREWLEFLRRTQDAEPVVARLHADGETVGWFTGAIVRRYGIRILGSPFPGWTTAWMGFNLLAPVDRWDAAAALVPFARELGCLHFELRDRLLVAPAPPALRFERSDPETYEIPLEPDEDVIFGRMNSACRRAIRRGEKVGIRVEEAAGEAFADEYYSQLEDVFAKQSLTPTYGVDRVRELIRCLEPSGRLLLVRATSPEGEPVATALFPAFNGAAYFWGGASWREHQQLRPNEAIFWYAIRHLKARGFRVLDLGGGGDYKLKYGPEHVIVPFFRRSRLPGLGRLRDLAERVKTRGY